MPLEQVAAICTDTWGVEVPLRDHEATRRALVVIRPCPLHGRDLYLKEMADD